MKRFWSQHPTVYINIENPYSWAVWSVKFSDWIKRKMADKISSGNNGEILNYQNRGCTDREIEETIGKHSCGTKACELLLSGNIITQRGALVISNELKYNQVCARCFTNGPQLISLYCSIWKFWISPIIASELVVFDIFRMHWKKIK